MDIKNVITKNGQEYGVHLIENNEEITVLMSALHSPYIFDGLLENGWKFTGLPYDFEKDGVSIHDLPKVDLEELGLSPTQKAELMDEAFAMDKYKSVDLESKKSVSDVNRYSFRKPMILIETREELLEFLDNYENLKLISDSDDVRFFMPLNSFVSRNALFTVEEYYDPANSHYRRKIESRRKMTVNEFYKMENALKTVGLSEEHSVLDLMENYFAWGICGIKFEEYEKNRKPLQYDILSYGNPVKSKIKERKISYIDDKGNFFVHNAEKGAEWQPAVLDYAPNIYIERFIKQYQTDYAQKGIAPVFLERDIIEDVIHILGVNVDIFINNYNVVLIRRKEGSKTGESVEIAESISINANNIKYDIVDIVEKNFKKCYDEVVVNSCLKTLEDRFTTQIDQSSYKLLKRLGGSIMSAVNKIINNDPDLVAERTINRIDSTEIVDVKTLDKDTFQLLGGLTNYQFIKLCKAYIADNLPENNMYYKDVALFINEVISGDINIDALGAGIVADAVPHIDEYKKYTRVAIEYMGYTVKEIIELINSVDEHAEYVMFSKNGMEMYMPVFKRDNKLSGYKRDFADYQLKAAKEAGVYIWVEAALTEYRTDLGEGKQRHVGVIGKIINFTNDVSVDRMSERKVRGQGAINKAKLKDTFNVLHKFIDDKVVQLRTEYSYGQTEEDNFEKERLADWLETMKDIEVSRMLFELYYTGKAHLPKQVGGDELDALDANNCRVVIKSVIRDFCDSTVMLTTNNVNGNGVHCWFCPNASITDYYVIPKANYELKEIPFLAGFRSTKGDDTDNMYKLFRDRGLIPKGYAGFSAMYSTFSYPYLAERDLNNSYDSLKRYEDTSWALMRANNEKGKNFVNPPHPAELMYSGVEEASNELIPITEKCKFALGSGITVEGSNEKKIPTITKAMMIDRFEECRSLFEDTTHSLKGEEVGFKKFTYLKPDDYYVYDDYQKILELQQFKGRYILKVLNDTTAVLDSGDLIDFTKIPELYQTGEYRINRITGDRYLIETFFGNIYECKCL